MYATQISVYGLVVYKAVTYVFGETSPLGLGHN